jgi:hypothetical protein
MPSRRTNLCRLIESRSDLHCRARFPSSLDTGPDALAPDVIAPARRTGLSPGRAFVPDGGASLPAIHDATAVLRTVAAGATTIRGADLANAWNDRDNTRYQNRPHVLPPSLLAQSTLHLAPAAADLLHRLFTMLSCSAAMANVGPRGRFRTGMPTGMGRSRMHPRKGNLGERTRLCLIKLEDTDHESCDPGTGFRICLLKHLRPGTRLQAHASPHAPFDARPSER